MLRVRRQLRVSSSSVPVLQQVGSICVVPAVWFQFSSPWCSIPAIRFQLSSFSVPAIRLQRSSFSVVRFQLFDSTLGYVYLFQFVGSLLLDSLRIHRKIPMDVIPPDPLLTDYELDTSGINPHFLIDKAGDPLQSPCYSKSLNEQIWTNTSPPATRTRTYVRAYVRP